MADVGRERTSDAAGKPYHLAALTAGVLIKSGPGLLGKVAVNKAGATGNVLTLYDGTSAGGTVIAVIDTTAVREEDFDAEFLVGLYAVLATGTAADVTITYA